MGEVIIFEKDHQVTIRSVIHFYGNAADPELSELVAQDISGQWNDPAAMINLKNEWYNLRFDIKGIFSPDLTPNLIIQNTDPANNYYRIESFATGNISFVDGIGSNTGYFLRDNLLHHSTTAAHEYGHSLGLPHPADLDIRGKGTPGIMYPRGTLVDPEFQYDAGALPGAKGGTLNPFLRKVLLDDIDELQIHALSFENGVAVIGDFTSVWHDAQKP